MREANIFLVAVFVVIVLILAGAGLTAGTRWEHTYLGVFLILVGVFCVVAGATCAAGLWTR